MYQATIYRHSTIQYTNTDDNVTAADNTCTSKFHNTVDNNVIYVRAVVEPSEIEIPKRPLCGPERGHHLIRKPQIVPKGAPLHTKWRLSQQRPRDGLRS